MASDHKRWGQCNCCANDQSLISLALDGREPLRVAFPSIALRLTVSSFRSLARSWPALGGTLRTYTRHVLFFGMSPNLKRQRHCDFSLKIINRNESLLVGQAEFDFDILLALDWLTVQQGGQILPIFCRFHGGRSEKRRPA